MCTCWFMLWWQTVFFLWLHKLVCTITSFFFFFLVWRWKIALHANDTVLQVVSVYVCYISSQVDCSHYLRCRTFWECRWFVRSFVVICQEIWGRLQVFKLSLVGLVTWLTVITECLYMFLEGAHSVFFKGGGVLTLKLYVWFLKSSYKNHYLSNNCNIILLAVASMYIQSWLHVPWLGHSVHFSGYLKNSTKFCSKFWSTSYKPISVADFGCRLNYIKRLITSCLHFL